MTDSFTILIAILEEHDYYNFHGKQGAEERMSGVAREVSAASEKCEKCSNEVPIHARACPVCNHDAGFPNVRSANLEAERSALAVRVDAVNVQAAARGASANLNAFRDQVGSSVAVMNRRLGTLASWINGDSPFFLNFYQQVEYLGRVPDGSGWDEQRGAAEATINPIFYRDLNIAALSLDRIGMTYYGEYSVVLRTVTIEDRASVFEENPFLFNARHHIVSGRRPPAGFRATWEKRNELAVAKLGNQIQGDTAESEFATLLMGPDRRADDCDFIEVHIFGQVNRMAIESVSGPHPSEEVDRIILKQVCKRLAASGATTEITS